jgi:hypothetical protein
VIRVLVFIKKIDSLSSQEFKRYYEDHHVPLVNELLPYYSGYTRSYLTLPPLYPSDAKFDFDVVTELTFKDSAAYEAWSSALAQPNVISRIRADEQHFLQSSRTQMWVVDSLG